MRYWLANGKYRYADVGDFSNLPRHAVVIADLDDYIHWVHTSRFPAPPPKRKRRKRK